MDELKEIIKIVSRNKIRKIEVIGQSISETKLFKLYELIESGEVNTNDDAIKILYPESPKKSRTSYFKLKYFLRRRLLNTIFFINTRTIQQEQVRIYVELVRKLMEIKLLSLSERLVGVKIAEKLLPKMEKYEFWDLAVFLIRHLRREYVVRNPDYRKFQYYDEKLKQVHDVESLLMQAEGLYYQLLSEMISNKSTSLELFEQAKEYEDVLSKQTPSLPSVNFDFYKNAITVIKLMCDYDYLGASKVLNDALMNLKNPKFYSGFYTTFLVNLVACNTYLKQYEAGHSNLEKALIYTPVGRFNWVQAKSTHVTLAFHSKKYAEISAIYLEVVKHPMYGEVPAMFKEIWIMYYAWLYLLSRVGLVELPPRFIPKKFELDEWLGTIKHQARDKNGLSINIRVIRTVNWLLDEDYDSLIDHDDSLKRFRYRFVKNNAQRRSNLLLRYLINIQKREFINIKCKNITQTAKKDFAELPVELKWEDFEIEIVPFDDVVELISDIMNENSRRVRS